MISYGLYILCVPMFMVKIVSSFKTQKTTLRFPSMVTA